VLAAGLALVTVLLIGNGISQIISAGKDATRTAPRAAPTDFQPNSLVERGRKPTASPFWRRFGAALIGHRPRPTDHRQALAGRTGPALACASEKRSLRCPLASNTLAAPADSPWWS